MHLIRFCAICGMLDFCEWLYTSTNDFCTFQLEHHFHAQTAVRKEGQSLNQTHRRPFRPILHNVSIWSSWALQIWKNGFQKAQAIPLMLFQAKWSNSDNPPTSTYRCRWEMSSTSFDPSRGPLTRRHVWYVPIILSSSVSRIYMYAWRFWAQLAKSTSKGNCVQLPLVNMSPRTPYPITPIGDFVGFILSILPLVSHRQMQAWNIGIWVCAFWVGSMNFSNFLKTIVWHNNVDIVIPVWCDIGKITFLSVDLLHVPHFCRLVTKLQVGAGIGVPACTTVLALHLFRIARMRPSLGTDELKRVCTATWIFKDVYVKFSRDGVLWHLIYQLPWAFRWS